MPWQDFTALETIEAWAAARVVSRVSRAGGLDQPGHRSTGPIA
jgi:hypothetical protein